MNFWDNLLRYPRFFLSSMIGLILVLITPVIKLYREIPNKQLFFFLFLVGFSALIWVLNEMMNLNY